MTDNNVNITIYESEEFGSIRTLTIDNEPWFVGKDVAEILGYGNCSRDVNRHVAEEDRLNYQNGTFKSNRGMTIINESGLYSLILSNKLQKALGYLQTAKVIREHCQKMGV